MPVPLSLTVYQDGKYVGEHRFERKTVKIGRLASAHLKLTDPRVSRIHAVIEAGTDDQNYSIVDMGSSEGTFLNSHKVTQEKLLSGDELRISNYRVVVAFGEQYKLSTQDIGTGDVQDSGSDIYAIEPGYDTAPRTLVGPVPNEIAALTAQLAQNGQGLRALHSQDSLETKHDGDSAESVTLFDVVESEVSQTLPPHFSATEENGIATFGSVPALINETSPQAKKLGPASQKLKPEAQLKSEQVVSSTLAIPQDSEALAFPRRELMSAPAVPNNLASASVPDTDRTLEIKVIWGSSVLDSITTTKVPLVTIGEQTKTSMPFLGKVLRYGLDVPTRGLPRKPFVFAERQGNTGTTYKLNLVDGLMSGRIEKASGEVIPLDLVFQGSHGGEISPEPGEVQYLLKPEETLYITYGDLVFSGSLYSPNKVISDPILEQG